MLYISNIEFVNKYLIEARNIDQLLFFCDVVKKLSKKYWKKLLSETFLVKIQNVDQDLAWFIRILKMWGKMDSRKISDVQRIIKDKSWDYTKNFEIESVSPQLIESTITQKLKSISWNVWVLTISSKNIWLKVKWEWMYYNRSLENDLEKLLD